MTDQNEEWINEKVVQEVCGMFPGIVLEEVWKISRETAIKTTSNFIKFTAKAVADK